MSTYRETSRIVIGLVGFPTAFRAPAQCQGWKANVVHHMNQKLVLKKAGSN